jgi:CRISPR-associated protein Cmr2
VIAEAEYAVVLSALRERTGLSEGPLSLVSFTIAGVQTFLDSARTTRDVWNGSYLVSYLMWKATEKALVDIMAQTGVTDRSGTHRFVLIPAIENQPFWQHWARGAAENLDVAHFPNTVLLIVLGDATLASEIARRMELAVETAWNEICRACHKPLSGLLGKGVSGELWNYQLGWRRNSNGGEAWQQIFEVYTSVCQVPQPAQFDALSGQLGLDPERGAAGQLLELAMRFLAARKALRDFEQAAHEGHRCSLCGSRSALANYSTVSAGRRPQAPLHFSAEALREFWQEVRKIPSLKYTFRDEERLCAVCVVRRLAPAYHFQRIFSEIGDRILFPSTSTIATAAWVADVLKAARTDPEVHEAVLAFALNLRDWQGELGIEDPPEALLPYFDDAPDQLRGFAHCDGRWFYEETYAPGQLQRDFGVDAAALPRQPSLLRDLMAALKDKVTSVPDDYIAVIMADGDRMGEWMSGRQTPQRFSLDWLSRLSATLADFANRARERLEQRIPAKVVYAGGDDVLAFAPRRCLLEAIEILDSTFDKSVRRPMDFRREDSKTPSLSVACVLAKHNEPLRGAIVRAHDLLKQVAKERLGRNAFAIYRTTAGVEAGAPFYAGGHETLQSLRPLLEAMRTKLSPQVRYSLENLADGLKDWADPDALEAARSRLIRRAFERHYDAPADSLESQQLRQCAEKLFLALCHWSKYKPGEAVDPFRTFIDLIGVLGFLARHES